jgi:ribosomal protein S12 methylthiotransferase accessory factor
VDPSNAIDYANLGVNLRKLGRKEEAIKNFKIALTMEPFMEFARTHLDELFAEVNQAAENTFANPS